MISIEKCRELLTEIEMSDSELLKLRETLYAMVESILDNYLEKFANMDVCKKQLSIAEFPQQDKVMKDTV